MEKIYVLDTNVLLHDPRSLFSFEDKEVVIPLVVLDELDKKKDGGHDEVARHARMVIRSLDEMRAIGNLHQGVKTPAGGTIRVEINHKDNVPGHLDSSRADNRIISVVLGIKSENPSARVVLITKDINLRVKCDALDIIADDYFSDSVADSADSIYSGISEIIVTSEYIDRINDSGTTPTNIIGPSENQYILLRSGSDKKHSALARFHDGKMTPINLHSDVWGISPKNKEQTCAFDALFNPEIKLVTMIGTAGTGKTLLAAAAGVCQLLDGHVYRKIIMTRPVVPLGRDIGFLPGGKDEKMKPWMAPLQDNLDLLFSGKGANYLEMERDAGKIEVEALTYIRGRSIPKTFIILDECLTGDHLIETSDGNVKYIRDIVAGDNVATLDIKSMTMHSGLVDGVIKRKCDFIYNIKTRSTILKCTGNHPLYTFENFKFTKTEAKNVLPGKFIPAPIYANHVENNNLSPDTAYFLGMILSDGHVTKDKRTIKVAVSKDIEHFKTMFKRGIVSICNKDLSKNFINKRKDFTICLNRTKIIENICRDYGIPAGKKSNIIRVPKPIFNAKKEVVRSFISACYDAEGDINITNSDSLVVNYTTKSKIMADEMNFLLRKFGISSGVLKTKKLCYRIYLTGIDAYRFYTNVGFLMSRKQKVLNLYFKENIPLDKSRIPVAETLRSRLKNMGVKRRNKLYSSISGSKTVYRYMINSRYKEMFSEEELSFINSFNFYEIKSNIREKSENEVYDFRVPNYGTFCVNGLISSNCQNLTRHEVKTILTRAGEDSKVVMTGDINQIDSPYIDSVDNGLSFAIEKFKNEPIAAHITLTKGERSELANKASELL